MSGYVTVRTAAPDSSDWDLELRDAASRRTLARSQGFGSHEVAQAWVDAGQRVVVRGRHRSGSARRLRVSVQLVDLVRPKADGVPQLVSVKFRDNGDLRRIDEAGLDLTHHIHHGEADVIVSGARQLEALKALRLPYEVEIADLNDHYLRSRQADARYAAAVARSPLPSGRTEYRVLADYQAELKKLVADHPGLVKPVVLPKKTFQGREIMGVEIAKNVEARDGRPVYFVHGMHHAREWPSAETVMEFAHLLAQGYGKDPRITRLLERGRISVVPMINVDGFVESREGAFGLPDPADTLAPGNGNLQTVEGVALLGGSFAYRRKNCNGSLPSPDVPCTLQHGIDPNRNYGNGWGGEGAGSDPITQSYRGPGPFSEPETQAVWEYSRSRQITNLITMHNVAALVLRPPGLAKEGKAPDEPRMKEIGDAMAAATGYTSQYGWQLYDTSGTTDDYTYAAQGGYGYTIEVGPSGGQFHMPYETGVVNEWTGTGPTAGRGLREALLLGAEAAVNPADHSLLTGRAAPGTVLRLHKSFKTATGAKCTYAQGYLNTQTPLDCVAPGAAATFDDEVDATMVVPADGRFAWHVNPSTRPFVFGRYKPGELETVGQPQTFQPTADENKLVLGAADEAEGSVDREFQFAPAPGVDHMRVKLEWDAAPEDFDLKLFKRNGDQLEPVGTGSSGAGSSGNAPGTFEEITVEQPAAGTYVLRVIYYATLANDWTATVEQRRQAPDTFEGTGKTEAYTLTCETADGKALGSRDVTVLRGQAIALELPDGCGGAQPRADRATPLAGRANVPSGAGPAPGRRGANRAAARGVTARVTPRRDRRTPYRFAVSGTVLTARGLSSRSACANGTVTATLRKGRRTIARRAASLDGRCRYRLVLTTRRRGGYTLAVRFRGSRTLAGAAARGLKVRAG
jgi:hypothetical protein